MKPEVELTKYVKAIFPLPVTNRSHHVAMDTSSAILWKNKKEKQSLVLFCRIEPRESSNAYF